MVRASLSRKVLVTLVVAVLLMLLQTSFVDAASRSEKKVLQPPQHTIQQKLVRNAGPSVACTINNVGDLYVDPKTGEVWKCKCMEEVTPQGKQVVCQWRGLLMRPSTWINFNSNLYMDVENVSLSNGARIHQWTYTGANNQFWYMNNPIDVDLTAKSVNSGKCLGVGGGSVSQGAPIVQWDCNGHLDQNWVWTWTGYYTSDGWPVWNIIDANSGQCLGIQGGSTQVGAYAVQWQCNGHYDQDWW